LLSNSFILFGFPIFLILSVPDKTIPETDRVH